VWNAQWLGHLRPGCPEPGGLGSGVDAKTREYSMYEVCRGGHGLIESEIQFFRAIDGCRGVG